MHVHLAAVEYAIGDGRKRSHAFAFQRDGVGQWQAIETQRVTPTGFAVAADQHIVRGIQKHELMLVAHAADAGERVWQANQSFRAVADVDAYGQAWRSFAAGGNAGDEVGKQLGREVVDAVVIQIFQRAQHHALARAGEAADDKQRRRGGNNLGSCNHGCNVVTAGICAFGAPDGR